jgi:hypothetical protein
VTRHTFPATRPDAAPDSDVVILPDLLFQHSVQAVKATGSDTAQTAMMTVLLDYGAGADDAQGAP